MGSPLGISQINHSKDEITSKDMKGHYLHFLCVVVARLQEAKKKKVDVLKLDAYTMCQSLLLILGLIFQKHGLYITE